jgi:hypothetical protein
MKTLACVLVGFGLALPVVAQEEPSRVQGYGYFGVMGSDGTTFGKLLNPGVGAEVFAYKGLAASADIGYVGYYNNFRADGIGLFSPNVSYHFFRSRTVVPFVTGGYSLAFRNETANLGNYGGGLTYWFSNRVGLRMEGRDQRDASGYHISGLRVGISFR